MIKDTSQQDLAIKPQNSKFTRATLMALVTVAALTSLVYAANEWTDQRLSIDKLRVKTSLVERGDLFRDIATTGKIVAANAPVIYSTELGQVTFQVKPGDMVNKNQAIAKIYSPELHSTLKQAMTRLQSMVSDVARSKLEARRSELKQKQMLELAKVELDAARREFNRGTLSNEKNLISKKDFEETQDNLVKAQLTYSHAQQETQLNKDTVAFEIENKKLAVTTQKIAVIELQRKVDELDITSPVAGIIGNWLTEQKAQVAANQPLMTVVDLTAFEAELNVPESYADELGIGMPVEVNVGGAKLSGKLVSISPEVSNNQVTTRVRMNDISRTNLRQNQRLSARIILEEKQNVLMVKRGAFIQSGGGKTTYLVQEGLATKLAIQTGASSISHIEILAGAAEGDTIVVSDLALFKQEASVFLN
ncbi:MAG: efflux RND transporter periplasmic adaptor subunit [Colwellia sp.]|nr:efflux RND transporter periplasmic adaptor subunit [Colwellia sp.]